MKRKKKLSTTILTYSIVLAVFAVALAAAGSMAGIMQVRNKTQEIIERIKEKNKTNNQEYMEETLYAEVKADAAEIALQYADTFQNFTEATSLCSSFIGELYDYPESVGESHVIPRGEGEQMSYQQLFYCLPAGTSYEDFESEIKLLGGAKTLFASLQNNLAATSIYYATDDGLMITMDDNSEERIEEMMDKENPVYFGDYDPRDREWYQTAKASGRDYVFSEVYRDIGGGEVITCSMAVYSEEGFQGVIAIDFSYAMLENVVVSKLYRLYDEYSKVMIEDGGLVIQRHNFSDELDFEEEDEKMNPLDINYFEAEEFQELKEELLAQSDIGYPDEDDNVISENIIMKNVVADGREYVCAGYHLRTTNLYYIMLVDKKEALDLYMFLVEASLEDFRDMSDTTDSTIKSMLKGFAGLLLAVFIIVAAVSKLVSGKISKPVNALIKDVKEVGNGNLSHKVNINAYNELEVLGQVFNQMTESLAEYMENLKKVTKEHERIATELNVASEIQRNMLPKSEGKFQWAQYADVYAGMHPAKEVGGDYYDYFVIDDRYLFTVVADVSGKGVPAALFMMMGKTLMHSQAAYLRNPADIMCEVNKSLNENNDELMFITSFMGVLDTVTGEFVYANAGHNPPLLYRADSGEYAYLEQQVDLVLAVMEDTEYTKQSMILKPGDKIFLYTDGVTEAANREEALYGEDRLLHFMNQKEVVSLSGKELLSAVNQSLKEFADGAEQADDITMLSLTFHGYKAMEAEHNHGSEITIAADLSVLDRILGFADETMERLDIRDKEVRNRTAFILDELFSNIAMYSHDDGMTEVCIRIEKCGAHTLSIELEDNGIPYNPLEAGEPDITSSVEDRPIGGLGIYLVKQSVQTMEYHYRDNKNVLKLVIEVS